MSLLRKLTTRPVWKWEKSRPYPIRDQWNRLPGIPARGKLPMVVLTTPSGFGDAMWTAWSWLRFLADDVALDIVIDGPVTDAHRAGVERISPGATIVTGREIIEAASGWPEAVRSFVERHPLGRKFGLTLRYQQQDRLLYVDGDVLAFNDPLELKAAFRAQDAVRYMEEPHTGTFDPSLIAAGESLGIAPRRGLNGGFLLLAKDCLDERAVEHLLAARADDGSWFTEQTLLALLMPPGAEPLPPDRYVVNTHRQFYWEQDVDYSSIAARHFTGPTRHVMYLKGLPILARSGRGI